MARLFYTIKIPREFRDKLFRQPAAPGQLSQHLETEVQPHLRVELLHADEVDGLEAVTVRGDEVEASVNPGVVAAKKIGDQS